VLTTSGAIFVAPSAQGGDDTNDGTQGAPVLTVTKAIQLAAGINIPIYICAGTYKEHVEVTVDNIALRGGFRCDDATWVYDRSKRARIAPSTKDEALRVKDVSGLEVTDLELVSADATEPGASSVAVFVSGSEDVTFTRLRVVAGNGADGVDGVLEGFAYAAEETLAGKNAIDDTTGALPVDCECEGTTVLTRGASGGDVEENGSTGQPSELGGGAGGEVTSTECTNGGRGSDAPAAEDGEGAGTRGTLDASGWVPHQGESGADGSPAQGGGGGAGAPAGFVGAGGGGGCGGCGGRGGGPGSGGGASIGILSLGSKIAVQSCTVETSAAGSGGNGIAGQIGQDGGERGTNSGDACYGGRGGNGGNGGGGGGGAGGISVGILSTMSSVTVDTRTLFTPGMPGNGGTGGGDMNDGIAGVAQAQLTL
jgi:hypothetical protein